MANIAALNCSSISSGSCFIVVAKTLIYKNKMSLGLNVLKTRFLNFYVYFIRNNFI